MDDVLKIGLAMVALALLFILYKCYVFAQANGIETIVVFETVLAVIAISGLAVWVVTKIGMTEGFCFWLVACWISLCPMLGALAEVNTIGPFLYSGERDPVWYGTWWFQWGFGAGLVGLSTFLLKRKHSYY